MQPRVTVALATVWLTVAVLIGGAVTLHLSHDQYSPASPRRHARTRRDYDPVKNRREFWFNSQRFSTGDFDFSEFRNAELSQDFPHEDQSKDIASSKRIPILAWQRRWPNIVGSEFHKDYSSFKMPETLWRSHHLLDDPFVADDTFQDQGPGSMEIYKLDLSREKTLLTATTPSTNLLLRNKSKGLKKTNLLDSKTKTTEIKSTTTNADISHRQSNFFEEQLTETPSVNRDAFGVGGVPELQVGCEGLEASSSHKAKRSIDTLDREKGEVPASALLNVTVSLDLDDVLSYDEEEYEEMDELFKLKKLETTTDRKKLNRGDMDVSHLNSDHLDEFEQPDKLPVRGDLGKSIVTNSSGFITDQKKLSDDFLRSLMNFKIKNYEKIKSKREIVQLDDDDGTSRSHGRRLLWSAEANTEGFADGKSERKRTRRSIDWGFGEDEGVVSSDELQTVNERRRQHEMRYHQNTSSRRDQHPGLNTDIDSIRREYETLLKQKRREEEERLRRMQQANRGTLNRWEEEERKRDEIRRQHEEYYKGIQQHTSTPRVDNEEMRRRQMEERQRQKAARDRMQEMARKNEEEQRRRQEEEQRRRLQEEEMRKRPQSQWQEENLRRSEDSRTTSTNDGEKERRFYDEEMKRREEERRRRLEEEEARRQEQYRSQQEAQRRREEEERRRQEDPMRNLSEENRRRLENRRREWSERRKQENENERRRQPPSNLMREEHSVNHPNDIRQHDPDEKRRQQEERERERKLQEYVARNRPINVNHADRRLEERQRYRPEENRDPRMNTSRNDEEYHRRVEQQRNRQEEERKLQDYIRRNQPVNVPSRDNQSTAASRNWFEERRLIEEARHRDRYPDPEVRRVHGPSAPTYIDPRSSPEEVRWRQQETARRLEEERRQRYEAEERRKELARRQWEKEVERRSQEERMREESARREEEARREQSRRYDEERKRLEVARIEAERRRQEILKERSKNEARRTKQPEATRPIYYQDPRLLAEHRRRQDSRPFPSNLMRAEEARRAAAERERQQEASRMREQRQKEIDQWRRQELARLNSLPVNARIIVGPGGFSPTSPVISRGGFDNEIDFMGINPHRVGVPAAQFPSPQTTKPPVKSPSACVWAIVQCCSANNNRLVRCFESAGCPGINWDPNPCRSPIADAARQEVLKFYDNVK